ncbi:ferredoxin reductase-like protein [Apiospora phragmitis]|uniref:Ferredoxin reductase-like protein n=1 Tax=Apiospora phragmitis TaxID=2905665 RepID=A0ABR1UHK4_9PEZI
MASTNTGNKLGHIERTAAEPRDKSLFTVVLRKIEEVNDQIRLFRLEIPLDGPQLRFLPGQWLDVYCPGVPKAGGFTITSPPSKARPSSSASFIGSTADKESPQEKIEENGKEKPQAVPGYVELAVQKSPANPPAAWLWQENEKKKKKKENDASGPAGIAADITTTKESIIGRELQVRVGGSFVWPPPGINVRSLRRVVFVAGGVGINPLIAMASSLVPPLPFEVKFLYSVKDPLQIIGGSGSGSSGEKRTKKRDARRILFLDRLVEMFEGEGEGKLKGELKLFLTGGDGDQGEKETSTIDVGETTKIPFLRRRIGISDVEEAIGGTAEKRFSVVHVCGVPDMTDSFVDKLRNKDGLGMEPHRVLCEKWW